MNRAALFGFLALFAGVAFAVPGTYNITPTFDAPALGIPTGYNLYNDCDVLDQTLATATLIGAVTSGQAMSIAGDSDTPINVCIVPFDASSNFPFDTVLTYAVTGQSPVQNFILNCAFVSTTPDGNNYNCVQQ